MAKTYKVRGKVWLYPGDTAAWHFVHVEKKLAAELREKYAKLKGGFGSIPVTVTIGKTTWNTSIFPSKDSGTYLLPLKAKGRQAEGIAADDTINFSLTIPQKPAK